MGNQRTKSAKLPALMFYPGDWRKDPGIQSLDYFERGVWFEMLCLMHESDERGVLLLNGVPMPEEALARFLGLDKQILTTTLTRLLTYGVASLRDEDKAIYSRRMVRDENIRTIRRIAGLQGGNPKLLKQRFNQKPTTQVNQIPTPSSSSSSSISSSDLKPPLSPFMEFVLPELTKEEGEAVGKWLEHKRSRRESYKTEQSLQLMIKRLKNKGITGKRMIEAIEYSMAQNYSGIFEEGGSRAPKNGTRGEESFETNIRKGKELEILEREGKL